MINADKSSSLQTTKMNRQKWIPPINQLIAAMQAGTYRLSGILSDHTTKEK